MDEAARVAKAYALLRLVGRRLIAVIAVGLGAVGGAQLIDTFPVIGSPQIDYPHYNFDWPWEAGFALDVVLVVASFLWGALGLRAWDGHLPMKPPQPAFVWAYGIATFAAVTGYRYGMFVEYGTMGPLGVPQPILRFALVEGLVCAALSTGMLALVSWLTWWRLRSPPPAGWPAVAFRLFRLLILFANGLLVTGVSAMTLFGAPFAGAFEAAWPTAVLFGVLLGAVAVLGPVRRAD